MTLDDDFESMRALPLFSSIDASRLRLMLIAAEKQQYFKGDYLIREGESGDSIFIVLCGKADVFVHVGDQNLQVGEVKSGEVTGEISVLCGIERTATIIASEHLEVLVLDKDIFLNLIRDFSDIGIEIMRGLAAKLERTTRKLRDAIAKKD